MRNFITATILCLVSLGASAQTLGINYQAIILDPNSQELPGVNGHEVPFVNAEIAVRFHIYNSEMVKEFSDHHNTTTDRYGMIDLLLELGLSKFLNFGNIVWDGSAKSLVVEVDLLNDGEFVEIATHGLTYTPHPMTAEDYAMIEAMQADIDMNEADSDAADAALQEALDANAAADAEEAQATIDADAALQEALDAKAAADQAESDSGAAADAGVNADIDANEADSDSTDAALQADLDANAAADQAESEAGDASRFSNSS